MEINFYFIYREKKFETKMQYKYTDKLLKRILFIRRERRKNYRIKHERLFEKIETD